MKLEYLNTNSTLKYPLADTTNLSSSSVFKENWFVDFQFVDFTSAISRVYIKQIVGDTTAQTVTFVLGNVADTTTVLTSVIPFTSVVSHIGNTVNSCYSDSNTNCRVKYVFGKGILNAKANFTSNFSPSQTELAPSTVIEVIKRVDSATLKNNYPAATLHTYNQSDNVSILPGFNIEMFNNSGLDIQVQPRGGLGLYNPCVSLTPYTDIMTVNSVVPRDDGNLAVTTDSCYAFKLLSSDDVTLLGSALDPYVNFSIPHQSPDTYNAVQIGNTFLITNYCKPKCAPENMNAMALYLNRIVDAVQELRTEFDSPYNTTGTSNTTASSTTFSALTFTSTYPTEAGFIPYFHEGKLLDITYSNIASQTVQIVQVLNSSSVVVTPALSTTKTGATFSVRDLGLFQVLNNAIVDANAQSANYNVPNGQVQTSFSEGSNDVGQFGTFIAVAVTIYNPTINNITFAVSFTPSDDAQYVSSQLKLLYNGKIYYDVDSMPITDGPASLGCKEYATVENVFFVPCGGLTGTVDVTTTRHWAEAPTPIPVDGELVGGSKTISIESGICTADTITTDTVVCYPGVAMFYDYVGATGTTVTFNPTTLPSWATVDSSVPPSFHNLYGTPTETTNTTYTAVATVVTPPGIISYLNLIIKVVTTPVITSSSITASINTFLSYQITATNNPTSYNATGLPTGLTVNTTTGIISGIPTVAAVSSVVESATNSSGTGSATRTFTITAAAPVITSSLTASVNQGEGGSYQIKASHFPTSFSASGLPTGYSINTLTGLIYGVCPDFGSYNITIGATNSIGSDSKVLVLTVNQSAPVVTSATSVYATNGTAYTYQITAINIPTSYNATSLPTGLSVNISTGLISGTPTVTSTTTMTVSATNVIGTGSQNVDVDVIS